MALGNRVWANHNPHKMIKGLNPPLGSVGYSGMPHSFRPLGFIINLRTVS